MFKKFLNLFRKKEIERDDRYASITYTLDDTNTVNVDVNVNSYDSDSIQKLAILLNTTHSTSSLMTTIEMIKQNLQREQEEDLLLEFVVLVATLLKPNGFLDDKKKKPCVSPSEMI